MDQNLKLTSAESELDKLLDDHTVYQRLIELIYPTMTRLDINFAVHALSQFMQNPR